MTGRSSILAALAAALLFGASTPFAKQLAGGTSPILLAGLLYLGSGVGLWMVRLIRDRGFAAPDLPARDWPWLLGAIGSGGVLAPSLLMLGLTRTSAADASLLLNLEAVLTAVLAWVVFRESADRRIVLGMRSSSRAACCSQGRGRAAPGKAACSAVWPWPVPACAGPWTTT